MRYPYFKRLKSLMQLGRLPKDRDWSNRAWLYGKLLIAPLTQKRARTGTILPPWDTCCRTRCTGIRSPTHPMRICKEAEPLVTLMANGLSKLLRTFDLIAEYWQQRS
jgi:hypothetical protein